MMCMDWIGLVQVSQYLIDADLETA